MRSLLTLFAEKYNRMVFSLKVYMGRITFDANRSEGKDIEN